MAGHIFVGNLAANQVLEFASGANGNVAPIAVISGSNTGLNGAGTSYGSDGQLTTT